MGRRLLPGNRKARPPIKARSGSKVDSVDPFVDPYAHAAMIRDGVRLKAFKAALATTVTKKSVVVDIGTGTGILAVLAARCGAKKVFAIERGAMIEVARRVVADNGLKQRVELIHGDSRDVDFGTLKPSVIVSETIGLMAFEQNILELVSHARKGHPDVRSILPARLRLSLVGLEDLARVESLEGLSEVEGVKLTALRPQLVRRIWTQRVRTKELLTDPVDVSDSKPGYDDLPSSFPTQLTAVRKGQLNAISGWWSAELAPGINLSNAPYGPRVGWSNYRFLVDPPINCAVDAKIDVVLKLAMVDDEPSWEWEVRVGRTRREGRVRPLGAPEVPWKTLLAAGGAPGSPTLGTTLAALTGPKGASSANEAVAALMKRFPSRYANRQAAAADLRQMISTRLGGMV